MPAWKEAQRSSREINMRHTQPDGTPTDLPDLDALLLQYLKAKAKEYNFNKHKCFFCGDKFHHTGYIPIISMKIWLCKSNCESSYREARGE